MAEVVNEMPEKCLARRTGRYQEYMDGQIWKLVIGKDIPKKPASARAALVTAAARNGMLSRTRIVGDSLYFQALTKD